MAKADIIDATELFKYVHEGIDSEDFSKAKQWVENNVFPIFKEDSKRKVWIKKSDSELFHWSKNDVDEFITVMNKLEELYKKRQHHNKG